MLFLPPPAAVRIDLRPRYLGLKCLKIAQSSVVSSDAPRRPARREGACTRVASGDSTLDDRDRTLHERGRRAMT